MSFLKFEINFDINNFPFEIIDLEKDKNDKLKSNFTGNNENYVLVGPKRYCLLESYKQFGPIYYNFPIRRDDVWLLGFPRSGTTLTQEIIWLICNDLNYEKASKTVIELRFPFFELPVSDNKNIENSSEDENMKSMMEKFNIPSLKRLMETTERRFIKSHLPITLINPDILKKGCKVIYIMRNPKDVLVSNFYLNKTMKFTSFNGNLEDYWKYFQQHLCKLCPYCEHLKEGWTNRHNPNFLFLFYEEILQDMPKALKKIANFLEKTLNDEEIKKLQDHLSIDNFRKNVSVNHDMLRKLGVMEDKDNLFIRKGKVNGWKEYFTDKMSADYDKWFEENMKECDLKLFE